MKIEKHHVYRVIFLISGLILLEIMTLFIQPVQIGEVLAVDRSEDSTEVRAVITAEKAQIKLFFVKPVPYQSPGRIDVIAKDINGHELFASGEEILRALPDSVFKSYNLPYTHENGLESYHRVIR